MGDAASASALAIFRTSPILGDAGELQLEFFGIAGPFRALAKSEMPPLRPGPLSRFDAFGGGVGVRAGGGEPGRVIGIPRRTLEGNGTP